VDLLNEVAKYNVIFNTVEWYIDSNTNVEGRLKRIPNNYSRLDIKFYYISDEKVVTLLSNYRKRLESITISLESNTTRNLTTISLRLMIYKNFASALISLSLCYNNGRDEIEALNNLLTDATELEELVLNGDFYWVVYDGSGLIKVPCPKLKHLGIRHPKNEVSVTR